MKKFAWLSLVLSVISALVFFYFESEKQKREMFADTYTNQIRLSAPVVCKRFHQEIFKDKHMNPESVIQFMGKHGFYKLSCYYENNNMTGIDVKVFEDMDRDPVMIYSDRNGDGILDEYRHLHGGSLSDVNTYHSYVYNVAFFLNTLMPKEK